ncbi:hypothetical protein V5799_030905, partial [Amblyomma americanum]
MIKGRVVSLERGGLRASGSKERSVLYTEDGTGDLFFFSGDSTPRRFELPACGGFERASALGSAGHTDVPRVLVDSDDSVVYNSATMKGAVVNICIFSLVFLASSAYKLPEDDFKLAGLVAAESMSSAEEAILVGHILREAARDIEKSHAEADEVEEYSWRSFWLKVKQALITAAKKIKAFFTKVGKELYESLKEVAKSAAEAALEAAKNKALEKAIQIADKIIEKSVA